MGIFTKLFLAGRGGGPRKASVSGAPNARIGRDKALRTILVATGDPEERKSWMNCLAHSEHRILAAEDGQAALHAIQANDPDLLVAAVSMAKLDGLELLRAAHHVAPRLRVILIAKGNRQIDRSYMKLAKLLGAVGTFTQPLDAKTLLSGVRTALELDTRRD